MTRRPTSCAPGWHHAWKFTIVLSAILLLRALGSQAPLAARSHGEQPSPYVDLLGREIRALSAEEVRGLLAGEGVGFALPAELNGYPGPKHVLELAEGLGLTADQVRRTRAVWRGMSEEARRLGALLVETERSLDRGFRERTIDDEELETLTAKSASLRGELRAVHLSAHLQMTEILSPHERRRYQQLRGYAGGEGHGQHGKGRGHHPSKDSRRSPGATEPGGSPGPGIMFTGQIKPVLYVDDVEAAASFYSEVLGLDFLGFSDLDGEPYYAELAAGPQKLGLHEPTNDEQEGWVGHQRLYLGVRDLEAHRARLVEAGADPSEIVETAWMDYLLVRDPSGHELAFALTDPERHEMDPWTRF